MADFLSRLAARTLGVASVVQPRTTSLFAQAGTYPLEAWQEHESVRDQMVPPPANMPVEKSRSALPQTMPSLQPFSESHDRPTESAESSFRYSERSHISSGQPQDVVPLVHGHAARLLPATEVHAPLKEESVSPDQAPENRPSILAGELSMGVTARGPRGLIRTDHPSARNVTTPIPDSEHGPRPFMSRRSAVRQNGMQSDAQESPVRPAPLVGPQHRTSIQSANIAPERALGEPSVVPSHSDATLLGASHRSITPERVRSRPVIGKGLQTQPIIGKQMEAEVIEASQPEPTIQVTIGRIEVRAMPPPAQPQSPQRAAPPVMSLDQYLQQRSKGGER